MPISLYSLLAALAVGGVGWVQIKKYQTMADSYTVASHELAAIISTFDSAGDHESWLQFVSEAEEVISREHNLWLASHSERPSIG